MKKLVLIIVALGLFVSCNKSNESSQNNQKVQKKELSKLVMGTNAAFPPFEYIGGATGEEVVGFDVEIAKAVAQSMGRELVVADMEFDTLLTALNAGKVDFVVAGMTINDKRKESVNFSEPYYEATQAVIVRKDNSDILTKEDIKDRKIAVQLGTTGNGVAEEFTKSITAFNTGFEAIMELKNGKVDMIIIDEQPAKAFLKKNSDLKIVDMAFDAEFYGIAVKKSNSEVLEAINTTLSALKSSGKYDELMSKYMK